MVIRMADLERIYVVPFWQAYEGVRTRRSKKAVTVLRSFISRHMKADEENVSISEAVNSAIWRRGIQKPPRKIKVKAVKSGEKVSVMLLEEGAAKEKKEGKKAAPAKGEKPPAPVKKEAPVEPSKEEKPVVPEKEKTAAAPQEAVKKEEEPVKPKAEKKEEAPKKE